MTKQASFPPRMTAAVGKVIAAGQAHTNKQHLTEIPVRSASQHLPAVARDLVDRLRRGTLDAVDLSRTSGDQQSILVIGIRWSRPGGPTTGVNG